jgi:HupE / UreJ protein
MTQSRRTGAPVLALIVLAALGLVVTPWPARAHDPVRETFVRGFVKIEPDRAHLVIRVPLTLLDSARFPTAGRVLDLANAEPAIQRALADLAREITISENGRPLAPAGAVARLTLPSDRSFERYDDAVRHVAQSPTSRMGIYAGQGFLDAHVTYAIGSPRARFTLRTTLAPELQEYVKLAVQYVPLGEASRSVLITSRSGPVQLNPSRSNAAAGFFVFGLTSILRSVEYVLLLLCLVLPLRGLRHVLPVVGTFTVGHCLTLLGSYLSPGAGVWFGLFVQTAGAAAIVGLALINVLGVVERRRWLLAGLVGLVSGLQFFAALTANLQLAGAHPLVSLLSFHLGLEAGQLALLAVMLPALAVLGRYVFVGRVGMIVLSAVAGHVAWHWMVDRADALSMAPWPTLDASGLTALARWLAVVLVVFGACGLVVRRLRSGSGPRAALPPAEPSRL